MSVSLKLGRFFAAGMLTGIALNASGIVLARFLLFQEWLKAISAIDLPPVNPNLFYLHLAMRFVIGFSLVWLFVVLRPLSRSRVTASLTAAFVVWLLAYLLGLIEFLALGIYPARLVLMTLTWGVVELMLVSLLGAWLYTR